MSDPARTGDDTQTSDATRAVNTDSISGVTDIAEASDTTELISADAIIPPDEASRLAAVHRYDILDTPPDGAFDRIATLAARFFDVPIATVTIVDEDRIWFKATHGVEVTEIGRDPGLCASAILRDAPVAITDATQDPIAWNNPLVRGELGLRFYAAAPIRTGDGYRLGTVNVIDQRPRQIGEDDLRVLTDLAAIVVDELELRLAASREVALERQRREEVQREKGKVERIAHTLQQSLLPPRLPQVDWLDLAAFHHPSPAQDVGGDFYDVFPLSGGRWAVTIGDVSGKGPDAAALTSLARYTLRGTAIQTSDPTEVMAALNTMVLLDQRDAEEPRYCTSVFVVIEPLPSVDPVAPADPAARPAPHPVVDPAVSEGSGMNGALGPVDTDALGEPTPARDSGPRLGPGGQAHPGGRARVLLSNGGHPPVVVCRADGSTERLTATGPMLGWLSGTPYPTTEVILGPGDGLLLYTDGITDARRYGQRFGEGRLAAALADRPRNDATSLVAWIRQLIDAFDPPADDDVAVLAFSLPAR